MSEAWDESTRQMWELGYEAGKVYGRSTSFGEKAQRVEALQRELILCYTAAADALCWARAMSEGGGPPPCIPDGEAERAVTDLAQKFSKERQESIGRISALQRERDEARERAKELDEERDRLLSGMAQQSKDVRALIEAAVACEENCDLLGSCWNDKEAQKRVEVLMARTQPFLPSPKPSRGELLEKEHEAVGPHLSKLPVEIVVAHRAVESAERGEGESDD